MPVIWNAPSPTSTSGRDFGIRQLRADARRNRKTHRGIIRRPQKFRAMPDEQVRRAEQRFANVRHHDRIRA